MKTLTVIKQTITLGFISSTIFLNSLESQALTVEQITNPRQENDGWVADMADILSDATEAKINRMIADLEQTNGTEIAVVTVPDVAPSATPKTFATELFNYWGIGKANLDNGVLYLISIKDRRVEIETGYGIESILPDAQVGNIIDTKILPQYKQGNFDRGTLDGTEALIVALESSDNASQETTSTLDSANKNWNWLLFGITTGMGLVLVKSFFWWRQRQNRIVVNPHETRIDLLRSNANRTIYCPKCNQPMKKVSDLKLTKPQQVAQDIGGASFRAYQCSKCNSKGNHEKHPYLTLCYFSNSGRYRVCPDCKELTVIRTQETIKKATHSSEGKILISKKCHCCDYHTEKVNSIPRLSSPKSRSSSYREGASSSSYSSGSYRGGSFGGGDSGGGGAGGGW